MAEVPILWHLKVSNFNEKARWALDFKGVPHRRRAVLPGRHYRLAAKLAGGRTFPVLVIDGEAIGDSTAIIAALEERWPERSLYPRDLAERRRALDLEDFFDEQLGPAARLLFLAHVLPDPDLMLGAFAPDLSGATRAIARATHPLTRRRVVRMYGIERDSVAAAYQTIKRAGERIRAERGSRAYLVGESFSVADLTAAALVAPLVAPPQFPYPQPQRDHPRVAPLRDALSQAGILDWTREMYARHRGTSAEI